MWSMCVGMASSRAPSAYGAGGLDDPHSRALTVVAIGAGSLRSIAYRTIAWRSMAEQSRGEGKSRMRPYGDARLAHRLPRQRLHILGLCAATPRVELETGLPAKRPTKRLTRRTSRTRLLQCDVRLGLQLVARHLSRTTPSVASMHRACNDWRSQASGTLVTGTAAAILAWLIHLRPLVIAPVRYTRAPAVSHRCIMRRVSSQALAVLLVCGGCAARCRGLHRGALRPPGTPTRPWTEMAGEGHGRAMSSTAGACTPEHSVT